MNESINQSNNQSIVCAQRLIGGQLSLLHVTTNKKHNKKTKTQMPMCRVHM